MEKKIISTNKTNKRQLENKDLIKKKSWRLLILTYNIEKLGHGLSGHEFVLEGPEDALQCLVDWHVVVSDIFCQREGPAPLCVACGNFLQGPNKRRGSEQVSGFGWHMVYLLKLATRWRQETNKLHLPETCRRPNPRGPRRAEGTGKLRTPLELYLWVWGEKCWVDGCRGWIGAHWDECSIWTFSNSPDKL